MKKIVYVLVFVLLCSCSDSIKNKAKEQMEKTFKELAKDPSSVSFNNVKVMYDNDSICIIHLRLSAKNGFGAMGSNDYEYVYLLDNKDSNRRAVEIVRDLKEKESIMSMAREEYQRKDWVKGSAVEQMSDDERKAFFIYSNAHYMSIICGRKVDYDKNDVDNW